MEFTTLEPFNIPSNCLLLPKPALTKDQLDVIIRVSQKLGFDTTEIKKFTKVHINYMYTLLYFLPIATLLKLYQNNDFLHNYMSNELYQFIIQENFKRFIYKLCMKPVPNLDYRNEVITLNNQINMNYNFSNIYINKRLTQLQNDLKFLDLSQFHIGSDVLLAISQKQPVHYITLYPNTVNIRFLNNTNVTSYINKKTNYHNIICHYKVNDKTFVINIDCRYYKKGCMVLIENDNIIYDTNDKKIYCRIEAYQQLNQPQPIKTIPLTEDYEPKNYATFKTVKYRYDVNKVPHHNCYVCKKDHLTHIKYENYEFMCIHCAQFNHFKKLEMADLSKCTVLVTGARTKIGFATALKLLRCGAKVIASSRFPNAAYYNYVQCPDYNQWKDNIIICKCDYTKLHEVMALIELAKSKKVNIFINNACQTIRSSEYYVNQVHKLESIIQKCIPHTVRYQTLTNQDKSSTSSITVLDNAQTSSSTSLMKQTNDLEIHHLDIINNDTLSTVHSTLRQEDLQINRFHDIFDKDTYSVSSWHTEMSQLHTSELMEVMIINQTIPTLMINALKPVMSNPKFIIQVTAVEGKFNTNKLSTHPHNNSCKAAMGMLIRTMSEENDPNQYIYNIDPGFVSGVSPTDRNYPLDPDDGASRILDPIICYYNKKPLDKKTHINLKNYKPSVW